MKVVGKAVPITLERMTLTMSPIIPSLFKTSTRIVRTLLMPEDGQVHQVAALLR
jgi:hypothetical protein